MSVSLREYCVAGKLSRTVFPDPSSRCRAPRKPDSRRAGKGCLGYGHAPKSRREGCWRPGRGRPCPARSIRSFGAPAGSPMPPYRPSPRLQRPGVSDGAVVADVPSPLAANPVPVVAGLVFVGSHLPVLDQVEEHHAAVAEEAPRARVPRRGAGVCRRGVPAPRAVPAVAVEPEHLLALRHRLPAKLAQGCHILPRSLSACSSGIVVRVSV